MIDLYAVRGLQTREVTKKYCVPKSNKIRRARITEMAVPKKYCIPKLINSAFLSNTTGVEEMLFSITQQKQITQRICDRRLLLSHHGTVQCSFCRLYSTACVRAHSKSWADNAAILQLTIPAIPPWNRSVFFLQAVRHCMRASSHRPHTNTHKHTHAPHTHAHTHMHTNTDTHLLCLVMLEEMFFSITQQKQITQRICDRRLLLSYHGTVQCSFCRLHSTACMFTVLQCLGSFEVWRHGWNAFASPRLVAVHLTRSI